MRGTTATRVRAGDIMETARGTGYFSIFLKAVRRTGFERILEGKNPLTVFAPTDDAFEKLGQQTLDQLMKNARLLEKLIAYHIIAGKHPISEVAEFASARTIEGDTLTIRSCGTIAVNQAQVVRADIDCANGIIHGIDAVLYPEEE